MIAVYLTSVFGHSQRPRITVLATAISLLVPLSSAAQTPDSQSVAENPVSASSASAPAQQSQYPEQNREKSKLETTIGSIKLRFYGTVLLNVSISDSTQVGQDVPLWPIPGGSTIAFPDGSRRPRAMSTTQSSPHDRVFSASILALPSLSKIHGCLPWSWSLTSLGLAQQMLSSPKAVSSISPAYAKLIFNWREEAGGSLQVKMT